MTPDGAGTGEDRPTRDPAGSVVRDVLNRPADPAYAAAAERRRAAGLNPSTGVRTPLLLLTSVLVGLLLTIAAGALRQPSAESEDTRAALQDRIGDQQATGDALSVEAAALREEIAAADERALAAQGGSDVDDTAQGVLAQEAGGATALQGPGVVVTLSDSPVPEGGTEPRNRVNAGDLQLVVNGMWASGAEAVVVNGQRLTSLSSIRGAGDAIVVDFRGLAPPYAIGAIGDPQALAVTLERPDVAAHVRELEERFGITTSLERPAVVTAPAAGRVETRSAQVHPDDAQESP